MVGAKHLPNTIAGVAICAGKCFALIRACAQCVPDAATRTMLGMGTMRVAMAPGARHDYSTQPVRGTLKFPSTGEVV